MVMLRHVRRIMVLMGLAVIAIGGCQGLRQSTRSSSDDQARALKPTLDPETAPVDGDLTKIHAVDADSKNPRPFFRQNRRAAAWSSEAREIESHLGVGP